jgi:hypothetical protein
MSFPTAFFLDTSVLDGQQYNFASAAFSVFVPIAPERKLLLLLPDPTKREVMRHIAERSADALRALADARRRAPFLSKWSQFPKASENQWHTNWEVNRIATSEWETFLKQFAIEELDYKAVGLNVVMNWYEQVRPPFGSGKKRKEFPDAFAIAALAAYAEKTKTYVAVVAEDPDFKGACEYFPYLLYFPSLAALTEVLLADEKTVETVRELVLDHQSMLEEEALDEARNHLSFYVFGEAEIDESDFGPISIEDVRVVGLGNREGTVAFEATLGYEVRLKREDGQDRYAYEEDRASWRPSRTTVEGEEAISGTAKMQISQDRTTIEKITFIELDNSEIEVSAPRDW